MKKVPPQKVSNKDSLVRRVLIYVFVVLGLSLVLYLLTTFPFLKKQLQFQINDSTVAPPQTPEEKNLPNRLRIPKLSVDAPIVYVEQNSEAAFQVALQRGVVHFPGTAKAGQVGNMYIFGHSSDFAWAAGDYKTILALLPNIVVGDEMLVNDEFGKVFTYRVTETKVVTPKDFSVLEQNPNKKMLSVQTSYPLGTALKRFVAIGVLVE